MTSIVAKTGFRAGLAACAATLAFDVVQILQVVGMLRFPLDETLIYATSLCIVIPFLLLILALHHTTEEPKRYWTHASLIFAVLYAVFVVSNYVVQLATMIPAKLAGNADALRLLDQTPYSLFWDYDAIGYIAMGFTALFAIPALGKTGFERWARRALLLHVLMTPVIGIVYFARPFSVKLLMVGFPWALTAPLFMLMLAIVVGRRKDLPRPEGR